MKTTLCGIRLRNPVIAASGTFAYGVEFLEITNVEAIGAFVVKGISRQPMEGNPPPRIWEAEAGMINSIGLQNIGVEAFVRDKLPRLRELGVTVVANMFGFTVEEYAAVASRLDAEPGIAALEVNISCPNVKEGGI